MKRNLPRKLFASFMILSMSLGQLGIIIPALRYNEAQASGIVLSSQTGARVKNTRKDALLAPKKKLSTDLLKLIDNSYLLPGENQDQVVSRMRKLKQYVGSSESVGMRSKKANAAHGNLVNVYVSVFPTVSTGIIDSYVWEVTNRSEEYHLAVALVDTNSLEALASVPGVTSIRTVTPKHVSKGSVTAEGDIALKTSNVRSTYAQQGAGVKIGVISDGVDSMSQAKSSGDLPSNITVLSNSYGGDEGTAMLEILYDMAPGASLYFHDTTDDVLSMNTAIDNLVAAGCKIIVDDLGFDNEAWFEDGVIAAHMASVMATKDVVFVSAAGNEADCHYQGLYSDNGSGENSKSLVVTLEPGDDVYTALQWNDKFGQSGNDYDLALYRGSTRLTESTETQDGSADPYEWLDYTNESSSTFDVEIVIENYDAPTAKTVELYVWAYDVSPTNVVAADSIYGHPNTKGVMAVGAIDAEDSGWDMIEYYSSRGPSTFIGETARAKPDITGIDNVSVTGAGDFGSPFAGTSAAAPAIGAVVAQLWGAFPTMKGNAIRDAIYASAVDLGTSGFDYTYGYGKADALAAYKLLAAGTTTQSSAKAITSFTLAGQTGVINEANHTITVSLPSGTSITSISPSIAISTGATISPTSGTAKNFTSPVIYTVTAQDGSTQAYIVVASVATTLSSAKAITSFTLKGVAGTINESNHTITVSLPAGTSITSAAPTIAVSSKATVSPTSGTAKNFTSPVIYTVTAEDGSTQAYIVVASVEATANSSAKAITSFTLGGKTGVIDESSHSITVSLPAGTAVTSLAPTIAVSANATVSPTSGTSKNFTSPVIYTVTAQDGSTQSYVVVVNVGTTVKSTAKAITSFTLKGVAGTIDESNHIITVDLPAGTSVTSLAPTIAVSAKATVSPTSGTAKNFTSPVIYTVLAEDGSSQSYVVVANIAVVNKSSAKTINSFILKGVAGVINESSHNITVSLPAGTSVTSLAPTIAISAGASVSPTSGTAKNFTSPVVYTVTAEDGSTQSYVVVANVGTTVKSSAKAITSFTLSGKAGIIDETNHLIAVTLPAGTNASSLAPTIVISAKATITPASGTLKNFTSPVAYNVIAEDGSTQIYIVTVTVGSSVDTTAPVITLGGTSSVNVLLGTAYNELGATAKDNHDTTVNVTIIGTVNTNVVGDYTVVYVATDAAGNVATASRVVHVVASGDVGTSADSISSFQFAGLSPVVNGIIDETNHKILLTVPFNTNVTALIPTITFSSGASVSPQSKVAQNYSVARTYTVTSASGSKQAYIVTVKIDASSADTVTTTNNELTITSAQKGVLIETLTNSNIVQAEIPKGAVSDDTTFTIKQETLSATDVPSNGAKLVPGLAFNIEGVDTDKIYVESLEENMTVTLTVPNLPKNTASLEVYYYDEARKNWAPVNGVTFGNNTITFIADYLATFAVFQVKVDLPAGIIDGDIIQCKTSTNPNAVYIVKIVGNNAYIRHIVSLQIFNYYKHLKWENLKQVGSLDSFSLSGWVRANSGTNGAPRSTDKVYEINGDQTKHWINMTAQQFLTHGGSDEAIYTVNTGELNLYANGPDVMSL